MPEVRHLESVARRLHVASVSLGTYAVLGGLISFLGWAADIPRLTSWDNNISIQPNATIAVMCAGVAVILLSHRYRRVPAVLGVFVTFIGSSVLFEYASGINLGIDTLLMFDRAWGHDGVISPGRMGPPGAVSWTFIGVSVLLSSLRPGSRTAARVTAPALALVAGSIASLSLIGYLYGASALYTVPTATVIALQTSTFVLAVATGLLFVVPESIPMRLLVEDSPAGSLVRRILPPLILVPVVLGLLRLSGERQGLYDLEFGTAARTIIEIALLSGLLWWTATTISRQAQARRQAEDSVVAHTRLLQTVTDEARVGLAIVSAERRYLYANRTYCEIVGSETPDIVGMRVADVIPEVYVDQVRPMLEQAFAGENAQYELNVSIRGRFAGVTYQPQFEGRSVKTVIVAVVDLTERKRVQEALAQSRNQLEADLSDSQLLQRISAEIIHEDDVQSLYEKIIDSAAAIMRSDFASIQILHHDSEAAAGGDLRLLAHRGFPPQAAQFWESVRSDSVTAYGIALRARERIIVRDVSTSDLLSDAEDLTMYRESGIRAMQSTPLLSRSGKPLGIISTHWSEPHDPSERELRLLDILARQAADLIERRQSEESLRHADRRKNEFLAILAHELRNPLAPVRNAVELIQRADRQDPELARAGALIDRQVALMARLLDDLLDVGRITSDKLELRRQRVDLATVIRDAVEMSGPLIHGFAHELAVTIPDTPIVVDADPARLGQVFGNLFNNACRYTEPRGRVAVSIERLGSEAVVKVSDTGIGIPADKLSSIFDMFSQLDRSFERTHSGLGIGLHLVKRLVEMHGGVVEAHSAGPGHGSEFVVRLPVLPESSEAETPTARPDDQSEPLAAKARRILVVDDNVDNAESLALLLEMDGNETSTAHDGLEAVARAEQLRPDVVLLDLGLPVLNGFDACRRIREQPWGKQMVLIAITGWGQDVDRRMSREAGFDHHLVKPVDARAIMAIMARPSEAAPPPSLMR